MARGKGSKIYDIDGNEYIDYVLSWGPLILGHANDQVVEALKRVAETGTSFGAPTLIENELAKLVMKDSSQKSGCCENKRNDKTNHSTATQLAVIS